MPNRLDHLLIKTIEECAEVIQRVCKAWRFGLDEIEPNQKLTNVDRIKEEMLDLQAVLYVLHKVGHIVITSSQEVIDQRVARIEQYLLHSKDCGRLD